MPGGRIERTDASFVQDDSGALVTLEFCERPAAVSVSFSTPGNLTAQPQPASVEGTKPASIPAAPAPIVAEKSSDGGNTGHSAPPGGSSSEGNREGPATTFFSVPAKAQKISYLIDASMSMGKHGALDAARDELLRSIRRLPQTVEFQVIVFNNVAVPLLAASPGWLHPTPQVIASVEKALESLRAEGRTEPLAALKFALGRRPEVLFFLTDAGAFRVEAAGASTRFNAGRSVIHVIELGTGRSEGNDLALRQLAHDNHGQFQSVPLPSQVY
jgi:hypothetical protein